MINLNQIYAGNALDVLKGWPDGFIDLTVTSPPYDNLRQYGGFVFDFQGIAQELWRVTKPGGAVVWVVADATINGSETGTSFRQALYFKELGFNLHDTMIYAKNSYMPHGGNRYEQQFEYMFVFSKGILRCCNKMRIPCVTAGTKRYRGNEKECGIQKRDERTIVKTDKPKPNIWWYDVGHNDKTEHSAAFPEELASDHIKSWSNPGDLILDPFMGSGTTAVVAKKLGRQWLGVELNERYIEMSEKRIEGTVVQNQMEGL